MSDKFAYLVLGSRGAGRRAVVADLVDFGLGPEETSQVFLSRHDLENNPAALTLRHARSETVLYDWDRGSDAIQLEPSSETIIVIADGLADPADFVEAFSRWLAASEYELGRILSVVDCQLLSEKHSLLVWYDACIHFSDAVLLSNRQSVSNKWIEEFRTRYRKQHYPCLFGLVKKGRVANPALILETQPRRMSLAFDEPVVVDEGLDDDEEEENSEEETVVIGDLSTDLFLRRLPDGRRERHLPDLGRELGA